MTGAEEFESFAREMGFEPRRPIEPGRWVRCSTNGNPNDDAGTARMFTDGEGGVLYDWRTGETKIWQRRRNRPLTAAEKLAWRRNVNTAQAEGVAERKRAQAETATRAAAIWGESMAAEDSHPYLVAKGVRAHGLRIYRGTLSLNGMACHGALIVPGRNTAGDVVTLSFIAPDGVKRFLPGPRSPGFYASIGKPEKVLCIAEGYATGASIHEATGNAVAVAFNTGNLRAVALALRTKLPELRLILCADDDAATKGNPGIAMATEAARAAAGLIAIPDFGDNRPEGATDFNDLASHMGLEAVRGAIACAGPPPPSPAGPVAKIGHNSFVEAVDLIRADTIEPQAVTWLWHEYLAAGKVHIVAGAPGTGKTTLALSLIACVTHGGQWPDGTRAPLGSALIWSGEDATADTLVPRLLAAGADLARVYFVGERRLDDQVRPFDPATDFAILESQAAAIPDLRVVLVDPIVSAVSGDGHKGNDVRRGLQPLVHFAERIGAAVIGISHFSKGTAGRDPVERVTGSIAFGALARVVLATAKVPEGDGGGRIMVRAKSNLGPDGGGFKYELRQVSLEGLQAGINASRLGWAGPLEGEARELLAAVETSGDPEERSATTEAAERLRELLTDRGSVEVGEARKILKAQGFSEKQIRNARERLGVTRRRTGFGGKDYWDLPDSHSCPVPAVDAQSERVGMNGQERKGEGMNDEAEVINDEEEVEYL